MALDKKFIDQFVNVTSNAALAASYLIGKKDKIAADQAAVDSMRDELNKINMNGQVVIGEGALDEAPLLYTGEFLGTKNGPNFDIAVDPVEGTNFVANNLPGGIAVLAIGEKGNLFNAPETYMNKIATGKIEKGLIDLDYSIEKNLKNLSDFKNKKISSITACILDRPRHKKIIDKLKDLNVNLNSGLSNLYDKINGLEKTVKEKLFSELEDEFNIGPEVAMVNSENNITNFHIPSDVIIDASMPAMIKSSGKMWNKKGELKDTKAVIPDSSYASISQAPSDFCKKHGEIDPSTMGTV